MHPCSRPQIFYLNCPRCDRSANLAGRFLFSNNKWAQIRCKTCRAVTTSSKWLCSCNIPWRNCRVHRADGFKCASRRRRCNPTRVQAEQRQLRLNQLTQRIGPLGEPDPNYVDAMPAKIRRLVGGCRSASIAALCGSTSTVSVRVGSTGNKDPSSLRTMEGNSKSKLQASGGLNHNASRVKNVQSKFESKLCCNGASVSSFSSHSKATSPGQADSEVRNDGRHSAKRYKTTALPVPSAQNLSTLKRKIVHDDPGGVRSKGPLCMGLCPKNGWTIA